MTLHNLHPAKTHASIQINTTLRHRIPSLRSQKKRTTLARSTGQRRARCTSRSRAPAGSTPHTWISVHLATFFSAGDLQRSHSSLPPKRRLPSQSSSQQLLLYHHRLQTAKSSRGQSCQPRHDDLLLQPRAPRTASLLSVPSIANSVWPADRKVSRLMDPAAAAAVQQASGRTAASSVPQPSPPTFQQPVLSTGLISSEHIRWVSELRSNRAQWSSVVHGPWTPAENDYFELTYELFHSGLLFGVEVGLPVRFFLSELLG